MMRLPFSYVIYQPVCVALLSNLIVTRIEVEIVGWREGIIDGKSEGEGSSDGTVELVGTGV